LESKYHVEITRFAAKQESRLPNHIRASFSEWVELIRIYGLWHMRKVPGFHDEALKGDRRGQRSSRLNRSYRVIYEETDKKEIVIISVLEINKHEY